MRIRDLAIFILAAALGGGGLFDLTAPHPLDFPRAIASPETVRILVARQALPSGTVLTAAHLRWVEWPRDAVPPDAFTSVEALLGRAGRGRRSVESAIAPGEPIVERRISALIEPPSMAKNLGKGMHAVSITVDVFSRVSDLIAPGDRVDVLLVRRIDGQLTASVILQDVTVLAIDEPSNTGAAGSQARRTVTVEADPAALQKLALAQRIGSLSLALHDTGSRSASPAGQGSSPDYLGLGAPITGRGWSSKWIADQPFHPILQVPPEAVLDPAGDWVPEFADPRALPNSK